MIMAIAEQFSGLEMDKLIGAPLAAAADASMNLANSTAEFINRVGFDDKGNVRNVAFKYQKRSVNEDGTSNLDEMKVDVPILAIVPIPNLQVDEVNILFDMEVKQSEKKDTSLDVGATVTGSLGIGPIKVSVTGNVSVHSNNTRSSDNSAKYHVDVRASNHGIPEGLARVLDMMAANIAPSLVGSTVKDANGQDLSEAARVKAENLKALRQEMSIIENRLSGAQDNLHNSIVQLKSLATSQLNVYQSRITALSNQLKPEKEDDKKKLETYNTVIQELNQPWTDFQNKAADFVKMLADSTEDKDTDAEKTTRAFDLFALKKATKDNDGIEKYDDKESYYKGINEAQKKAVNAQRQVDSIQKELLAKKEEYNNAMADGTKPALTDKSPSTPPTPPGP